VFLSASVLKQEAKETLDKSHSQEFKVLAVCVILQEGAKNKTVVNDTNLSRLDENIPIYLLDNF